MKRVARFFKTLAYDTTVAPLVRIYAMHTLLLAEVRAEHARRLERQQRNLVRREMGLPPAPQDWSRLRSPRFLIQLAAAAALWAMIIVSHRHH